MITDLQKASILKRISAALFDVILLATLAVGIMSLLGWALGYDAYAEQYTEIRSRYVAEYAQKYGVEITGDEASSSLTPEQREAYKAIEEAMNQDPDAVYYLNMSANLSLVMITFSILFALLVLEFAVPLLLKNGQTLGKKIFSVALMRSDGVKVSPVQMFVRTVLGKFAIEIMIPVYMIMMITSGSIGIIAIAILGGLLVGQLLSLILSKTNNLIHDSIAGTVAVDMASQMIFETSEAKIEYIKRLHAEQVSRQEYK